MSEQPPTTTADEAFKPEIRERLGDQGDVEWQNYLDSRPKLTANGRAQAPDGGFINVDSYFEDRRDEIAAEEAEWSAGDYDYKEMSAPELARQMARAEHQKDKTTANDIADALDEKLNDLDDKYYSERDTGGTRSVRDPKNDTGSKTNNDIRSENLEDRVMKIHDRELARLEAADASAQNHPEANEPSSAGSADEDEPSAPQSAIRAEDEQASPGDHSHATPETEILPIQEDEESSEPPTEVLPPTEEHPAEPEDVEPADEGRWARLHRRIRKHLYYPPIDMTPMGPPDWPEKPFEEWWAEKQAKGPGFVARTAEKAATKTAEKLGDMTEFVDYIGNVALIDTAYYAGNAADAIRFKLEGGKDLAIEKVGGKARSIKEKLGDIAVGAMVFVDDRIKKASEKIRGRGSGEGGRTLDYGYQRLLSEVPDDYQDRDEFSTREFGRYDKDKIDLFKAYLEKQIRDVGTIEVKTKKGAVPLPDSSGIFVENGTAANFLRLMIDDVAGELLDYHEIDEQRFSELMKKYLDIDVTKIAPDYYEKFKPISTAESE